MKRSVILLSCLIIVISSTGCSKKASEQVVGNLVEKMLEKNLGSETNVEIKDGELKVTSKDETIRISDDNIHLQSADRKMQASNGALTLFSKEGNLKAVAGSAALNVPMPEELYKYKNAKIIAATNSIDTHSYILETQDKLEQVLAAYKLEMEKKKWIIKVATEEKKNGFLMLKKEKLTAQITITADDQRTQITIVMVEKQ